MTHEYRTKSGKLLTSEDIQRLADEAERGYDLEKLRERHDPVLPERFYEVARRTEDGRILVCYGARDGWYMIANEDDVTRQSVVLTHMEVRWLAELWHPSEPDATHDNLRDLPCWNALRLEVHSGIVDDVIERVSAVFAERERVLRTTIVEAMKFQPCHKFCSHLWCDKGIDEQSLDDLIRTIAERGYTNAELMKREGAAERERKLRERIEALPRPPVGRGMIHAERLDEYRADVLAVFDEC